VTESSSKTAELVRALLWGVAAAAFTVSSYLVCLGWQTPKDINPETREETGPYTVWQVLLLATILAAIAATLGWLRLIRVALAVVPTTLTVLFAADTATAPNRDGLWAIGTVLVALGSLAGVAVAATLGRLIPARNSHPQLAG
jgi:hypothetical protein